MVNKEDALGLLQHRIGKGRNSKQIDVVSRVNEMPSSCCRRQVLDRIFLVGHNHVAIHRLIEMG